MTLIDKYLAAVAAQLPAASREDVVAELRDDIMNRVEAREEDLGRSLSDDEVEAILREIGHPLAVAARFGSGPQHLVGPELFPWWFFGVKVGLMVLAVISVMTVVVKVVFGADFSQALSQGFHGFFEGGITLIGIATIAGFIFERQEKRPDFIDKWRVKDLSVFEVTAFDAESINRALNSGAGAPDSVRARRGRPQSPVTRALGSAVGVTVLLLWWIGAIQFGGVPLSDWVVEVGGVDYGPAVRDTVNAIFWPVVVYGVARIAFDLFRAVQPRAVRLTALGDSALAGARLTLSAWLLFGAPIGRMLGVTDLASVVATVRGTLIAGVETGVWSFGGLVVVFLALSVLDPIYRIVVSAWRFLTGRDSRLEA